MLVATSGDTGSAVANAFFGVAGTRVVVLYPEGKVSDVQEAQFTTLGGNVTAVAVAGTFDDCQRLAKEAFADRGAAVARAADVGEFDQPRPLLPQMFYYAYAALQSVADKPLTISVPSRQFRQPRRRRDGVEDGRADSLRSAAPTTINDTVPRYFATGRVEPRPSVPTLANAMDVGNPSNLERLQWLFNGDLAAMQVGHHDERATPMMRCGARSRRCSRSTATSRIRTPRLAISALPTEAHRVVAVPGHRASGEVS